MLSAPPLIVLPTEKDYQNYYTNEFCRKAVFTADSLRVYFSPNRFWHAFCTRDHNGKKDKFSIERAQYIGWIKPTLGNPNALLLQGWNADLEVYEPHRRVNIVFESFIVVIEIQLAQNQSVKASFITAYYADKSINKIKKSPKWSHTECLEYLTTKKPKGR